MAEERAYSPARPSRWLNFAVAMAILVFLGRFAYRQWPRGESVVIHGLPLAVASCLMALSLIAGTAIWTLNLRFMGEKIPFAEALKAFLFSQLCRYVPGKVWLVLGRAYLGRSSGIGGTKIVASTAVEFGTYTLSGLAVGAAWFAATRTAIPGVPPAAFAAAAAVLLVCLHPAVFRTVIRLGSRWAGKPPVEVHVGFAGLGTLFACYALLWGLIGVAFHFFVIAMDAPTPGIPDGIGLFAAAAALGCLAIFAPAGIGVREAVLSVLLLPYIPPGKKAVAIFVALAARVWIALVEGVVTGLVFLVFRPSRPRTAERAQATGGTT